MLLLYIYGQCGHGSRWISYNPKASKQLFDAASFCRCLTYNSRHAWNGLLSHFTKRVLTQVLAGSVQGTQFLIIYINVDSFHWRIYA